jgi:hypothetical protein
MLLLKLFHIIDNSFIGRSVEKRMNILASTDPNKMYLENIRSFYHIPKSLAQLLCNMAVKERLFIKKIEITCPHCGRCLMEVDKRSEIPESISCDVCELNEVENFEFNPTKLTTMEFYSLNKKSL